MKFLTFEKRRIDVRRSIIHRQQRKRTQSIKINSIKKTWKHKNRWIDSLIENELIAIRKPKKYHIELILPVKLNFSDCFEETALYIKVIRFLTINGSLHKKGYKLRRVNFCRLREASTSASLVLTAEISKWEDSLPSKLIPEVDNWDTNILRQFNEVGYFNLFEKAPEIPITEEDSPLTLVRYIKGTCGDVAKTRELKTAINSVVGDHIKKWMFLRTGLDEAITNVSHHAYPDEKFSSEKDKIWYLTGSYNRKSNKLKIVFYDQGIGIPQALPVSEIWERVLKYFADKPFISKKLDATLLKAAVELDRTGTGEEDRGKGLQDMLEFVKQREEGYLSILSGKGLYKYTVEDGEPKSFNQEILGTLIIWCVTL